jgi:CheY-specific phosphatase CheX
MSSRFFGQYLLEKGRINSQQLADAMEQQKTTHTPIGLLTLEKGLLSTEQVKRVLERQKKVDRSFGELAIIMGYLTQAELDELLQTQARQRMLLGDALVSKGYLPIETLENDLEEYKKEEERVAAAISEAINRVLHNDIVKTFTDLMLMMFTRFGKQVIKIEHCETGKDKLRLFRWVIAQKVAGSEVEFNCLLSVPPKLLLQMASTMLDEPIGVTDELALDATKEFVNIANGNACVKLSETGRNLTMLPPEIYETTKQPYRVQAGELVCVHLTSPESKLELAFEF